MGSEAIAVLLCDDYLYVSFFVSTTRPAPHLDDIHVVFGHVIQGQEYVTEMENQKVDTNHRPYADVRIINTGELVRVVKGTVQLPYMYVPMHIQIPLSVLSMALLNNVVSCLNLTRIGFEIFLEQVYMYSIKHAGHFSEL